MIKGVLFDMDGVLVDNRELHMEAFRVWGRRNGMTIDEEALLHAFGMGNKEIIPRILHSSDFDNDTLEKYGDEKEIIYRELASAMIQPMRGLPEFLDLLRQNGMLLAVGSSGMRKNVDMVLKNCCIKGYFNAIVDGDQLQHAKPNPEVYLKCAEKLHLKPEECIVCEDAPAGIKAARRAGMKVIAVASTFPREEHHDYDLLIEDFRELTDINRILI